MRYVIMLYRLALKLYPRPFRLRFAREMEEVFRAGLEEAHERGVLTGYVLDEALRLPVSLADVYVWFVRGKGGGQMAVTSAGGGTIGMPLPGERWGASLLAGLPNLIMGILVVSSTLAGEIKGINQTTFNNLQWVVYALLLLGVLLFSIFKGWQIWSASWLFYMFFIAIALLSLALNALAESTPQGNSWVYEVQVMTFPLLLAYLLYKITCQDRLRGLLAAVPPMALLWTYFQEFVPALPKSLAFGWLFLLAFAASVLMLRTRRFSAARGLALAVPVLGGLPFTYLGVYMGGTLPFSEPGPSWPEVFRQYLPFLAAVASLALGPQLAAKLRAVGRESAQAGGKIFYRLALGGLLLALALALVEWNVATSGGSRWVFTYLQFRSAWLIAALVLYLAGFLALVLAAIRTGALSGDKLAALRLPALFILLPGVPGVLFLSLPNIAWGSHQFYWLILAAEIVWVLAAAWLVTDQ